jgi:hypothetical protein
LSDILKNSMFQDVNVLILDAPTKVDDPSSKSDGIAAFEWASDDGERVNKRRVIHVSSLGSFADKGTVRETVSLQEITMRPWTRADFVQAVSSQ